MGSGKRGTNSEAGGSIRHMRIAVEFQDERVELDVPEGRLVASWNGPTGAGPGDVTRLVAEALENPREFPPLRQAVVPGDRVVIALGADVPEASSVLETLCGVLEAAGVGLGTVTVMAEPDAREDSAGAVPRGVAFQRHDPDDRTRLAYLATTTDGRRVYLNRALTDADIVVPVGRLGYDPVFGYEGPWGVIFPGMSDTETRRAYRAAASDEPPDRRHPRALLTESSEVSWLLGSQFQLGVIGGVTGTVGVVAGLGSAVLDEGSGEVDDAWAVRTDSRAELVIAGVGRPGAATSVADLARGLGTATRLVQRGGKVVLLSRAGGPIGPSVRRLVDLHDPRDAVAALRGHEPDADYAAARSLAHALAWADIYLLSALERDDVEGLSMIPLDRPEEAGRLAALSGSCLVLSHADLARASVAVEAD